MALVVLIASERELCNKQELILYSLITSFVLWSTYSQLLDQFQVGSALENITVHFKQTACRYGFQDLPLTFAGPRTKAQIEAYTPCV